jgi:hypothetical protein
MNSRWIVAICIVLALAGLRMTWAQQAPGLLPDSSSPSARVIIAHDPQATEAFKPDAVHIKAMLERALCTLTAETTTTAAWRKFVSTQDIVGIKVFTSPGPTTGTRPEVVAGLIETLVSSGVTPSNIVIWDRTLAALRQAGFNEIASRYGVTLQGSIESGWDTAAFYETPLLGQLAYTDLEFGRQGETVGRRSYVTKLLTRRITRIINVAPLLNHNRAGVSGLLYSLSMGAVDNTLRFESDPARLATAVPEIYALPEISDRVVLSLIDALVCQYAGEHISLLHYSATLNELWLSQDPVALDTLAVMQLEQQRRNAQMANPNLNKELYDNASLLQLGVGQPGRIRVERVEPQSP